MYVKDQAGSKESNEPKAINEKMLVSILYNKYSVGKAGLKDIYLDTVQAQENKYYKLQAQNITIKVSKLSL